MSDCNVMIDDKNFLDQAINSELKALEKIRKIATGHGDDYTTGCLLHYSYFKENFKMLPIDIIKQQALDADARANQFIFTANLRQEILFFKILFFK